jgi:hypothetical protein
MHATDARKRDDLACGRRLDVASKATMLLASMRGGRSSAFQGPCSTGAFAPGEMRRHGNLRRPVSGLKPAIGETFGDSRAWSSRKPLVWVLLLQFGRACGITVKRPQ